VTAPALTAWAPGRVNLIGEHTDYSGGLVLPAAVQLGVTVEVRAVTEDVVLDSTRFEPAAKFSGDGTGPETTGWGRYAQAVAVELAELGRPAVGLSGSVSSDLPAGVGLSSSAALEVAVALALCGVADFELEPLQLALACQRAEVRAVGVPVGILDQAASVLGADGAAVLIDCSTLDHRLVPIPASAALVVIPSGVERTLEASDYAQRRKELEAGLAGATDDVSVRRARHVTNENERVRRFARALEAGDLEAAGRLIAASHASLRDDYEVSTAELDLLVELATAAGAHGARLVGGGFGGSILALADAERADDIGRAVVREYRARTGRDEQPLVVRPSAGASIRR
jgi:galactokinase